MIQFNIQFKIESKIFIQWIIHSIFSQKYRFNELFIQYSVRNIDSKFYSKNWIKTIQIYVIKPTQWKPAKRERFPKIMPRACRGVPVKKTPWQIHLCPNSTTSKESLFNRRTRTRIKIFAQSFHFRIHSVKTTCDSCLAGMKIKHFNRAKHEQLRKTLFAVEWFQAKYQQVCEDLGT